MAFTIADSSLNSKPLLYPIPDKLNENNFFTWQQQALFAIFGTVSTAYTDWNLQAYNLGSWLLASMDVSFWNQMYVAKIKGIVDSLVAIGAPISHNDHIEALCDGLTEQYAPFVITVKAKSDMYTINEVEALLNKILQLLLK
ncbi:hypothetical protein AHAS_Ahas20G0116000 [Arachis hypogaea]